MSLPLYFAGIAALAVCLAFVAVSRLRFARSASLGLAGIALFALAIALQNHQASEEAAQLRASLAKSTATRESLHAELSAAQDRERQATSRHRTALDRIERHLADVHRTFRSGDRDVVLQAPARETASLDRFDAIEAQVEDLKSLKAKPVVRIERVEQAAPREDGTRDLVRLRDRLAQSIKTDSYDVEPYPGREIVGGRVGKYYAIDIKNASSGIRYFFDGGKYVLHTGHAEFRTSLNAFIRDVLGKLDGNARYDLFVRGNADAKPFEGRIDTNHPYSVVSYLKQSAPDRYTSLTGETRIEKGILRNADLPNLRAAFMRDLVSSTYPVKTPIILEGAVTPQTNERDRNVELILFVDW